MNMQNSIGQHDHPAELALLLELIRSESALAVSSTASAASYAAAAPDWKEFVALAHHHRVYPTIQARCAQHPQLPEQVKQWLTQTYNRNALTMLQLSGHMQRLSGLLDKQGICALQLKGPVLAQLLYGDLSRRTSKDLDVLVPMEQAGQAEQLLLELGYVKTQAVPRTTDNWRWRYNHESYTDERTGIEIELHWRLNGDVGKEQSFAELWSRRQTLTFGGTDVHRLGNEDLLIYLAVHGARHAWFRLRWLVDIDRLLNLKLDEALLQQLARQYQCQHIVGQALVLAAELLHTPLVEKLRHWTEQTRAQQLAVQVLPFIQHRVNLCPEPETETLAQHYRSYQYALKTTGQKALFWVRKLAPDDWDMQTLALPKRLYWLYYPLHPFLLLYRRQQRRTALQREVEQ
ncbi:nucleotidyltransferase family protein [Paenibacillus campi]|uniref:nucleotidyltransferase domain-containing protein n=1 Tax=Paenibacillus campi TaxID=3106031 RepID=UPI002AFFBC48|nr:nucleotidyltransferase family protein [Paenibacillus sp. SGZ-1014]